MGEGQSIYKHVTNLHRYTALSRAAEFSSEKIELLRDKLSQGFSSNVQTVALCGSMARHEASECSDVDSVLILKRGNDDATADQAFLNGVVQAIGGELPNPQGVFVKPRSLADLIDNMGHIDEEVDVFSKRMLLLMESRPVFNDSGYEEVIDQVYDKYAHYLIKEPHKQFVLLLNDLIRYFRYICLSYESMFGKQQDKWPLRNIKLRHSRVLIYMGLLSLIGASSLKGKDKVDWLRQNLSLLPLDRIALAYEESGDESFHRVVGMYNVFLGKISMSENRRALNDVEYKTRYDNQLFSELKANSDAFIGELVRFIFEQRGKWSERFFEYLVF